VRKHVVHAYRQTDRLIPPRETPRETHRHRDRHTETDRETDIRVDEQVNCAGDYDPGEVCKHVVHAYTDRQTDR